MMILIPALRKGSDMYSLQTNIIVAILFTGFLLIVLMGCKSKNPEDKQGMTIKETLSKYRDEPIGKSLDPVVRCLAGISVMSAIGDSSSPTEGNLKLRVDYDNQGRQWAYIYTDKEEFSGAFPEGNKFVEMTFSDFFEMIESDSSFGGIYINHSREFMYVIPQVIFPEVRKVIGRKVGHEN